MTILFQIKLYLLNNWEQDEMYRNKYETHLSCWNIKDFDKSKIIKLKKFNDDFHRRFCVMLLSEKKKPFQKRDYNFYRNQVGLFFDSYPRIKNFVRKCVSTFRING